jgi:hypothetical protein
MDEWKKIPGVIGYEASNGGEIRSKYRILKWSYPPNKRPQVGVKVLGKTKKTSKNVATLVAYAWLGERPGGHEIHHKDRDPNNNKVENLEYLPMLINRGKNDILGLKYCPVCNKRINHNRKTCSRVCQKTYSHIALKCEYCAKEFTIIKSQLKARQRYSIRFFCSRECSDKRNRSKSVKL